MNTFLQRYQHGECQQVWDELLQMGQEMRQEHVYFDALAVAHETMKRVRQNIEVLIPRLEIVGYQFGYEWMKDRATKSWIAGQPNRYKPPLPNAVSLVDTFETEAGMLPLSLRAFYLEVGSINLFGRHPIWEELGASNLNPLCVWGLKEQKEKYDEWVLLQEEGEEEEADFTTFHVVIAPDDDLKYNTDGQFYEIEIPCATADAYMLNIWPATTFVQYLRECLYSGGLLGLERISNEISQELHFLHKDLLPF